MHENFLAISYCLSNDLIRIPNRHLHQAIQNYNFFYIYKNFDFDQNQDIYKNMKESKILIVNQSQENDFFIICFQKTLLFIEQSSLNLLQPLFTVNQEASIMFLSNSRVNFSQNIQIKNKEIIADHVLVEEALNLQKKFVIKKLREKKLHEIWKIISLCISFYLIKQSYIKLQKDRITDYQDIDICPTIIDDDEYVELRVVGDGSLFFVKLIYHIEKEEFFVVKQKKLKDEEIPKLTQREFDNYSKLKHPFIPKFFGQVKKDKSLVFEFINGQTLLNIKQMHLNEDDKIKIILELLLIISFLHHYGYVYRDLKPSNVMIDERKNVVLIDFDRMLNINDYNDVNNLTCGFMHNFFAPEIEFGQISVKSDVYSLGKMIYYIINEEEQNDENKAKENNFDKYSEILPIINKCTMENPCERPHSKDIFCDFFEICCYKTPVIIYIQKYFKKCPNIFLNLMIYFFEKTSIESAYNFLGLMYYYGKGVKKDMIKCIQYLLLSAKYNYPDAQYSLGKIYLEGEIAKQDLNKGIRYLMLAVNNNLPDAQYILGEIYLEGVYTKQDINKGIQFLLLSSNNNFPRAQYKLGIYYLLGKNVEQDINKGIQYLFLSANNNYPDAQCSLGRIYLEGEIAKQDLNKGIRYLMLAVNNNLPDAQYILGEIYLKGVYTKQDINKGIQYLFLSANNNFPRAQYKLGIYYLLGEIVGQDINKGIKYLFLSANNNFPEGQYLLGYQFLIGIFDKQDINKGIFYLSKAASGNCYQAQIKLSDIYLKGEYGNKDINKGIHYLLLAAKQNSDAMCKLGIIYYKGIYVPFDIKMAIFYLTNASNQNNAKAQYHLGLIYYQGIYISRNINIGINYLTLAANNNYVKAQFKLGYIFIQGEYIEPNIAKSIHYYAMAANNNHSEAQYNLASIFDEGKFIKRNIEKAVIYYKQAANNGFTTALYRLGIIYLEDKNDIKKGINYLKQAADQNSIDAQFKLGVIYYDGLYVPRDIQKSIYYYTIAANQNDCESLVNLGNIFSEGIYVPVDIDKAIHYYLLAVEQNDPLAQFSMGLIYFRKKHQLFDINKAIYYFSLAAAQNYHPALYNLGYIYHVGYCVKRDINKAIEYYSQANSLGQSANNLASIYIEKDYKKALYYLNLASNKNCALGQYNLGVFYLYGLYTEENIKKGLYYITLASKNGDIVAHHALGYLYHIGFCVEQDINKAISYYKEASSFNNQYSKNNLGIIYKNGFENIVEPRLGYAIELFKEAIYLKNDKVAMYNLANIYFYQKPIKNSIDQALELLIKSAEQNFDPSFKLLFLILVKKFGENVKDIEDDIAKYTNKSSEIANSVFKMIYSLDLNTPSNYEDKYQKYQAIDFLYSNIHFGFVQLTEIKKEKRDYVSTKVKKLPNISSIFYDGFGSDLL